jgi:hypothetical protein
MTLIKSQDPEGFHKYLEETDNTICRRHRNIKNKMVMRKTEGKMIKSQSVKGGL